MSASLPANSPAWDIFTVSGAVAVITGGGSGLGLMFAKALEANGASKVYILGRNWRKLDDAAKQSKYGRIVPLPGDVTSKQSLKDCVEFVRAREGFINILILSAGVPGPGMYDDKSNLKSLEDWQNYLFAQEMPAWNDTFNINVTTAFFSAIAFLDLLEKGNHAGNYPVQSQVIGMTSTGGYLRGLNGSFPYAISKTGVRQLMQSMATHFAPWKIRFNALAMGGFRSELTEKMALIKRNEPRAEDEGSVPASMSTAGRIGRESEAAGAVLYLTSLAGGYTNGAVLLADGGTTVVVPSTYG